MAGRATPEVHAKLLEAVDLGLAGDWQGAHLIAQDHEGDPVANWIHRRSASAARRPSGSAR